MTNTNADTILTRDNSNANAATKPTINTNAAINYQDNINANSDNIKPTIPILIAGATPTLTLPDCCSPILVQY
jgi:hypothetical protein